MCYVLSIIFLLFTLRIEILHGTTDPVSEENLETRDPKKPDFFKKCFGYRGNGTAIFSTMGGIARLIDQYGEPDAQFGTSSGAIAAFLTESVLMPNRLYIENSLADVLSEGEQRERKTLMLKSVTLLADAMITGETELGQEIKKFRPIFDLILKAVGISFVDESGPEWGLSAENWKSILTKFALNQLRHRTHHLHKLINPEFYKLVGLDGGVSRPELIEKVIINLLVAQGSYTQPFRRQYLFYPGFVNFDYLFELIGYIGDWYAGYGKIFPREKLHELLDFCAKDSVGQWWNEIANRRFQGSTCGEILNQLFVIYFNKRINSSSISRRILEPIGKYVPAFVSTSAIGINAKVDLLQKYADQENFSAIDEVRLTRNNFNVLYFGPKAYQNKISRNQNKFNDVVTSRTVSMGPIPWQLAMKASGQEPATGRPGLFLINGKRYLGTGGYVDQLPTKLMRNLDCHQTFSFNTNHSIINFASRYTEGIWTDGDLLADLFGEDPESAESIAFRETDALLCGRWSSYGLFEFWEMADNAFHNKIISRNLLGNDLGLPTFLSDPRQCYQELRAREHRYPRYSLPK